jgi:signal transduction histidine kinase
MAQLSVNPASEPLSTPNAAALLGAGLEAYQQSNFEQALATLEEAELAAKLEQLWSVQAQALIAKGKVYRDLGLPNEALNVLSQALELAQEYQDVTLESDALNQRAGVNHNLGEYALALRDLTRSLELAKAQNDNRRIGNTLINMGILSTKLGDYPRALTLLSEAHKLIRVDLRDGAMEAQCLINLGLLFEDMGDNLKALETCQAAHRTVSGLNHQVLQAITTVNLGNAHQRLGQLSSASSHFQNALAIAKDIKFAKVEIAALDGLGQIHRKLGQSEEALELHKAALERSQETNDSESELDALLNLARDYLEIRDYNKATNTLELALELANKTERKKSVTEAHELFATLYEKTGDLKKALEHFRFFHRFEKDLFNEEREKKTRQLMVQFDVERAQYQAEVYRIRTDIEREAREKAEATVQERTLELVQSNKTISQQRQELQDKVTELHQLLEQNETLRHRLVLAAKRNTTLNERFLRRLSAELHDGPAQDLGYALIKLGSDEIDAAVSKLPEEHRESYSKELTTIHTSVARALREMRAIAGGMCLPELEHLSLSETISRSVRSHQRRTQSEVNVTIKTTQAAPLPVKITLYRLVQEALMNSFKHAHAQGQVVKLFEQGEFLHLEVSDTGPGFAVTESLEQGSQLGLAGMRERVESLGGKFWLESELGKGTTLHAVLSLQASTEHEGSSQ